MKFAKNRRLLMKYKTWFGLAKTQAEFASMKPRWMPRIRDALHDALWDALKINDDGQQTVWEIEGDDDSRIDRQEIVEMVRQHRQELTAKPPQKY
jgi:hypothetical protein